MFVDWLVVVCGWTICLVGSATFPIPSFLYALCHTLLYPLPYPTSPFAVPCHRLIGWLVDCSSLPIQHICPIHYYQQRRFGRDRQGGGGGTSGVGCMARLLPPLPLCHHAPLTPTTACVPTLHYSPAIPTTAAHLLPYTTTPCNTHHYCIHLTLFSHHLPHAPPPPYYLPTRPCW